MWQQKDKKRHDKNNMHDINNNLATGNQKGSCNERESFFNEQQKLFKRCDALATLLLARINFPYDDERNKFITENYRAT